MYQALIIGCGNIGAMYDFDSEEVATYAKAFSLDTQISFDVYDIDRTVSQKIADRYGVRCLYELPQTVYRQYDIVVISTPTFTHHEYLSRILESGGPRLVICEKPVDVDRFRLRLLLELYRKANIKVMVNFFRRFQPGVYQLREKVEEILKEESCSTIVLTYQRGFHNNASHAVDLLEFLFDSEINFHSAREHYSVFDEFETDPTLSLSVGWNHTYLQIIGLTCVEFSHFEIWIYFSKGAIFLRDGGNVIEYFSVPPKTGNYYPKLCMYDHQTGVLRNYMINVVSHAKFLLEQRESSDNFLKSVSISERILNFLGR